MLKPPVISLPDPMLEEEGSVDPLSLARTYERLADRMLPAVTVRMSRIRFLSAMCVGSLACSTFEPEALAADEVSPPWLVFEWFVIEAFARAGGDANLQGIAGLQKVRRSLDSQRPVSAATYLKTPKVFGFSGIFRRLANGATILDEDLGLDDGGWELLRAFERDEKLEGLIDGGGGDGATFVRELREAVKLGLERGHTVGRPSGFWERITAHLVPTRCGKRERAVLLARLRQTHELSSELVDDLVRRSSIVARHDEAAYLRRLAPRTSPTLRRLLGAIDAYEALCRPITDAFALVRHLSTAAGGAAVAPQAFAQHKNVPALVNATIEGCKRIVDDPALLDLEPAVRALLGAFDEVRSASELFRAVVAHHEQAQRDKPPDGKRSWLEPGPPGSVMVRPAYQVEKLDDAPPPYVHDYRVGTVGRFLADLGAFA